MIRLVFLLAICVILPAALLPQSARAAADRGRAAESCVGDCTGDGQVTVDELVRGVNLALALPEASPCPAADANSDGQVTVDELVTAVRNALFGCTAVDPTPTPTRVPTWEPLEALPEARQEVGVTELNGRIYVIGGFDEEGAIVDTVEFYDPLMDEWQAVAPLPQRLHHVPVVSVYGRIYALGGLGPNGFTPTSAVYVYDPQTDTWESRAPLPTARGAAGAAVIEGRIYVAGGLGATATADFTVYDPDFDAWEMLPPMPTARDHLGAAAVGGVFYAIGGRAGGIAEVYDVVEAYDPTSGRWETDLAPLPTGRAAFGTAVFGNRIFAMGGEGNPDRLDGVFPQVEVYDPAGDLWLSLPDMPTPRHGMGAAVFADRIIVPGGATVAGFAASAVNEALVP